VWDCKNKEWTSASHPECAVNISLQRIAEKANMKAQDFPEQNNHCYFKKNSDKILIFICSEKIYSKGQVNLLFTKINQSKNLESLRLELQKQVLLPLHFFQQKISLPKVKFFPKSREHCF
jgi:hypothetical protein